MQGLTFYLVLSEGSHDLELVDLCLRLLIGGGYGGSLGPTTFGDAFSPLGVDPVDFTF